MTREQGDEALRQSKLKWNDQVQGRTPKETVFNILDETVDFQLSKGTSSRDGPRLPRINAHMEVSPFF